MLFFVIAEAGRKATEAVAIVLPSGRAEIVDRNHGTPS